MMQLAIVLALVSAAQELLLCAPPVDSTPSSKPARYDTITLRGRVAWKSDALARRHGVQEVAEAAQRELVLETAAGELHPLVEDVRGRSFRRDARLREMEVEVTARRYAGSPFVQIVQILEVTRDGNFRLDYWCEICSIAMYELKECDCCQGPIELRRTPVK